MPTDLKVRATDQHALFAALATAIRTELGDARHERDRRHDTPDTVAPAEFRTEFGAAQHLTVVRARLAANRAAQDAIRAGLAAIATPAEAGADAAALATLLVAEAELRVGERDATERVEEADSLIADLAALAAAADGLAAAAQGRVDWATTRQTALDQLRAALASGDTVSVVADAGAALGGVERTAADTQLDALMPADLRARGEARLAESAAAVAAASASLATAEAARTARVWSARPLEGAVRDGEQALARAEAALTAYVSRATGQIAAAVATFDAVAGHPALDAAQDAALDPAGRADAITAAGAEGDLTVAADVVADAQRAVDDAILVALDGAPDDDPDTHPDVIAARAALADATLQTPLTDARAAYDAAASAALDAWEIEVPPSVWEALADFVDARETLTGLSSQAARDALVTAVDDATDVLAAALDERDVAWRGDVEIDRHMARRAAAQRATAAGAAARRAGYGRGDGRSGRTAREL